MIIEKDNQLYRVRWRAAGWSYAVAFVEKRVKFLFWHRWKDTKYESSGIAYLSAKRMMPQDLENWFIRTFNQYWEYKTAWENHSRK